MYIDRESGDFHSCDIHKGFETFSPTASIGEYIYCAQSILILPIPIPSNHP